MNALITNDDGFDHDGIRFLQGVAASLFDQTTVVAPMTNQSGAGTSRNLRDPLTVASVGKRGFIVGGTPVDCVEWALTSGKLLFKPDIVLSGVNYGANTGKITITCSGTVGACLAAAARGLPAIAFSQDCLVPEDYIAALNARGGELICDAIKRCKGDYRQAKSLNGAVYNVNLPKAPRRYMGIANAKVGSFGYDGQFSQHGKKYQWLQRWDSPGGIAEDDTALLSKGYLTISKLKITAR